MITSESLRRLHQIHRSREMGRWNDYKKSRAVQLDLAELDETLDGLWVKALPTTAQEPSVALALEKSDEDVQQQGRELMKVWVLGWNLPYKNNDDKVLPIPLKSNDWESNIPLDVQLHIANSIRKVDEERVEVPQTSASE